MGIFQFSRFALLVIVVVAMLLGTVSSAQAGRIVWPCSGTVTSPYGPRTCSECASNFHYGIDIGVGVGTNLGSPGNGTVKSYSYSSCGGNTHVVGYENGWETRFLHCSASIQPAGTAVTRNVDVAKSGNTGTCTSGPHLHFEVRKDGVAQSIPGADNSYVTRATEIPADYAGLNDLRNPSYYFNSDNEGWTVGNASNGPAWTNTGWPGVAYGDQLGSDMFWYSPPTSYAGGGDPSINVQIYPQNGSSASHTMQMFWKTNAENTWDSTKSTPRIGYTAQNSWISLNLNLNNSKYWYQTINRLRLDFDDTSVGARFIVNHVLLQTTPRDYFPSGGEGWTASNGVAAPFWTDCCGWPGVLVVDQTGIDSHIQSGTFNFRGARNDQYRIRLYPQNGTTASHQFQLFWTTSGENFYSEDKSVIANYTAQNAWITVDLPVGNNTKWEGNFVTRFRLDMDQANTQTRYIIDQLTVEH